MPQIATVSYAKCTGKSGMPCTDWATKRRDHRVGWACGFDNRHSLRGPPVFRSRIFGSALCVLNSDPDRAGELGRNPPAMLAAQRSLRRRRKQRFFMPSKPMSRRRFSKPSAALGVGSSCVGVLYGAQSLPVPPLPPTPAEDRTLAELASGSQQSITNNFPV